MCSLFIQRNTVISSFIVPWVVGLGCKTPTEAIKYIKRGETLNPFYYPLNKEDVNENGEEAVYVEFMNRLFDKNNIDFELTRIIGENVYTPWDCMSGIYQVEINDKMGLVARPNGITQNNECVILVDDYLTSFCRNHIEEEIRTKLLSTMAVWKARKGVYIIKKMNKTICVDFDSDKWNGILCKVKKWADTVEDLTGLPVRIQCDIIPKVEN